jgi:hypothetical protein
MSSLNIATDIPSQIVTLEQLAAWAGLALTNVNPSLTAIEGQGYTERCCQANPYFIAADNKHRLIIRQSIVLSSDYLSGGRKLWLFAQELSTTAVPAIFKTN